MLDRRQPPLDRTAAAEARRLAPVLWALLGLFALRVGGQALVAFGEVRWLPPMAEWQSGLLPYPVLLTAQLAIVALLARVCLDFSRGRGWFLADRSWFAAPLLAFGWLYLAAMIARYPLQMALHPEDRWLGRTIPIVFHWVLAGFVLLFARFHRARRAARAGAPP
jgi:hypothetical protein